MNIHTSLFVYLTPCLLHGMLVSWPVGRRLPTLKCACVGVCTLFHPLQPAVREMTQLLTELRECKQQNIQLVKDKEQMGDELLAFKMALEEVQPPPPQQRPVKTQVQAMIVLYQ